MHIVTIAWVFVVVLMALAEATSPRGTVLGALFTLLLYGALPLSIVLYLLGTPGRRRARLREQAQAQAQTQADEAPSTAVSAPEPHGAADAADTANPPASAQAGDGRSHAPGGTGTPERKEP